MVQVVVDVVHKTSKHSSMRHFFAFGYLLDKEQQCENDSRTKELFFDCRILEVVVKVKSSGRVFLIRIALFSIQKSNSSEGT